jgi:hypothetical protein
MLDLRYECSEILYEKKKGHRAVTRIIYIVRGGVEVGKGSGGWGGNEWGGLHFKFAAISSCFSMHFYYMYFLIHILRISFAKVILFLVYSLS